MFEFYKKNKIILDKIIFILVFLILSYFFIKYFFSYIAPFFLAFVMAVIFEPLVCFLAKYLKLNRAFSAIVCIVLLLLFMFFVGSSLIGKIWHEGFGYLEKLPYYIREISELINNLQAKLLNILGIPALEASKPLNMFPEIQSFLTKFLGSGLKDTSINFVTKIPDFIMWSILFFISLFFFIKDKFVIRNFIVNNCPNIILKYYMLFKQGILGAFAGYLKAQSVIICIISIINICGLMIIGYEFPLFMGLTIAVVDALPILGSGIILIPWSIFNFFTSDSSTGIQLIILYIVNFLTRQFLEPKVLSSQIGLYPVVTLASIFIGLKIFGFLGFLIGPLIIIMIKTFLNPKPADC